MRIMGKRIDGKSFAYGMGFMALLCVVPMISKPVLETITKIRDSIGGNK